MTFVKTLASSCSSSLNAVSGHAASAAAFRRNRQPQKPPHLVRAQKLTPSSCYICSKCRSQYRRAGSRRLLREAPTRKKTYRRPELHTAASRRCYATQAQVAEFDSRDASQDRDSNRIGRGGNRNMQLDSERVGQARRLCGQAQHAAASSKCRVATQESGSQVARHRHTLRRDGPKLA
jgi:hypothetical protein